MDLEFGPIERDLRRLQEDLVDEQRRAQLTIQDEEDYREEDRRQVLAKLDAEVKTKVLQLDSEIKRLMSMIEEDEAKSSRLERLIKQYNNNLSF